MAYFFVIFFCVFALFIITRPLTVLLHELGHAIPAILFTKQKVTIYIGSYGNPNKSLKLNIGLLEIWFTYNPFFWNAGLCVPESQSISVKKQIIYTLFGPLTSITIAVIALYSTFYFDLHSLLKIILLFFLFSSILDLFINLIPSKAPTKLHNGKFVYNDGHRLKQLLYIKKFSKDYEKAITFFNQKNYTNAAASFNKIIDNGFKDENIYRLAISSFLFTENYKKTNELVQDFLVLGRMDSDDFSNAGVSYSRLHQNEKALDFYNESLKLNPENFTALNNKGFVLNVIGNFDEAIVLFDKAIQIDVNYAYSYSNRGLAKIKVGRIEEGLEDINQALKLDEFNSYAYRNLGIYHFDKGEKTKALELFTKAKELDNFTYLIDELIFDAKN